MSDIDGRRDTKVSAHMNEKAQEIWRDGIAIIGMSAHFPQSQNVKEYWQHLLAGDILISDFSEDELRSAGVSEQELSNPNYVRRGCTLSNAESLDAALFNFSRREAEIVDPQQRVLLECAWEALEDAGYTGEYERVGIFAGVGMNSYLLQLLSNPAVVANAGGYQLMLANDKDYCATRVAYKLNLRGPAVTVQSACSTSLAAVHLACLSLLAHECDMALAGGCSIIFPQGTGYTYMPGMILSPDGFCRPFDVEAKGTVPSRGAGLVVLKRLSQAIADADSIIAVIRGSAWNNDGAGKVGFTAPSIDGQVAVLRAALAVAGASPNEIGYIEAHGTATELGDPIEVAALATVFGEDHAEAASCFLGAAKSNMGHADAAAGVAGLIKAALAVRFGIIPPTPTYTQANPSLHLDRGPFTLSASAASWPKAGERWAGVNSFGIGGTNVHVILSEGPASSDDRLLSMPSIFPLSARSQTALGKMREQLANHLEESPALAAQDVSTTLQLGRREFAYRRAYVGQDMPDLLAALRKPEKAEMAPALSLGRDIVYLFPGQGQQFLGMAAELYKSDLMLRQLIDEGATLLRDEFDIECVDLICGREGSVQTRLYETEVAQPLLFLVEFALASRWRSLGVEPVALLGHSLGELTAATVSGVFSYHDGLRLAAERGLLMSRTPPGIMLAVMLPPDRLGELLVDDVWLAAENGSKMTVASGPVTAVEVLEQRLRQERIAYVRLASKNAFHTPLMSEAAKAFRQKVESVSRSKPQIPLLSNVTGTWIDPVEAQSPLYWGNQILSRVRFTQNLLALADRPRLFIEVGPGEALIGIARQQAPKSIVIASLGAENRRRSDDVVFLEGVAKAWESGAQVKWKLLRADAKGRRVSLPTYPFEREKYYVDPDKSHGTRASTSKATTLKTLAGESVKRSDITSWFYASSWQSTPPVFPSVGDGEPKISVWLVLLDNKGLGKQVVDKLGEKGVKTVSVTVGKTFAEGESIFSIDPANPEHYRMLWQAIDRYGLRPEGLLNFWTIREMAVEVYDSMILLLQAARIGRQRFRQIDLITDDLESIAGEPIHDPTRSQLLGLLRMIPAEYVGTHGRSIDVHLTPASLNQTAEEIIEELQLTGQTINVAYRQGLRWQRRLIASPLPTVSESPFREAGVYLITGGIGGIGYSLAQYLLRDHNANVVLTGRSKLPPDDEWEGWLAREGVENDVSKRILRMKELNSAGGKVVYLEGDVTSEEDMTRVVKSAETSFGIINGVIHAAGVAGSGTVATQAVAESTKIRSPKVSGSLTLVHALEGRRLDFLLLCSSISAWIPALAQGAYAAANAFEDYFAMYCQKTLNIPAVAIGFDAWQEVGMAAEMELPAGLESVKEERLRTAMTTTEGIEIVRRVLSMWRAPHILTSTIEIDTLLKGSVESAPAVHQAAIPVAQHGDDPQLSTLIDIWKDLLAIDAIEPTDNFFELGGHSLMGTMLITRIRDQFGVILTLRTLFESPTPLLLVECLRPQTMSMSSTVDDREEFAF